LVGSVGVNDTIFMVSSCLFVFGSVRACSAVFGVFGHVWVCSVCSGSIPERARTQAAIIPTN
jgi:hypothetical protein